MAVPFPDAVHISAIYDALLVKIREKGSRTAKTKDSYPDFSVTENDRNEVLDP